MKWVMLLGCLVWLGVWIVGIAKAAAARQGQALVKLFAAALPAFSGATLLLLFAVIPRRGMIFELVLWMHHAAIFALFAFLLAVQLSLAQVWWQIRGNAQAAAVAATVSRIWVLTEVAPAPIALAILLTGLRLIWESPADSPAASWLMTLIVGFSFFFFDGLLSYTPIVRRMHAYWQSAGTAGASAVSAAKSWRGRRDQWQLFAHCLSWPLLFMVGAFRWNYPSRVSAQILRFEHSLSPLPESWQRVVAALMLWALCGGAVALIRMAFRARLRNAETRRRAD